MASPSVLVGWKSYVCEMFFFMIVILIGLFSRKILWPIYLLFLVFLAYVSKWVIYNNDLAEYSGTGFSESYFLRLGFSALVLFSLILVKKNHSDPIV